MTEAQRVETEEIACELDDLKKRAESSGLPLMAFLIDIALSEARDELAHGHRPTQCSRVGHRADRHRFDPKRIGPEPTRHVRQVRIGGVRYVIRHEA